MRSIILSLLLTLPVMAFASPEEERKEAQEMRQQVLAELYKEKPASKAEIEKSKGYAVFSNLGINLFVVSTARGGGILHDNRDGKDTYMSMLSAGGGLGLGQGAEPWLARRAAAPARPRPSETAFRSLRTRCRSPGPDVSRRRIPC